MAYYCPICGVAANTLLPRLKIYCPSCGFILRESYNDKWWHETETSQLHTENARLEREKAELGEALYKYGKHQNDEHGFCDKLKHSDNPCSCGFETTLDKGGE